MWIFTTIGAFSIVEVRTKDDRPTGEMMVRVRDKLHLTALKKRTGCKAKILSTPHADYPYRVIVSRDNWHEYIDMLTRDIAYPNFKGACASGPYLDKLHQVWSVYRGEPVKKVRR